MVQPGRIAFPVILVLGAITGYITYSYFTAAIPDENRIDSPYYQPLSPTSGGDETGNTGEAVQTAGGGNQTTAAAVAATKQQQQVAATKQQQQVALVVVVVLPLEDPQ